VYNPVCRLRLSTVIPSIIRRRRIGPLDYIFTPVTQVVTVFIDGGVLGAHVRPSSGAEKSRHGRRRKRGLRKGKRRSRGCHPRRSVSIAANVSKDPNARRVNHAGRKFIWAAARASLLRKKCARYEKIFGGKPTFQGFFAAKRKMRTYLIDAWKGCHERAESMGLHPIVSFSTSPEKFFEWDPHRTGVQDLEELISGLPGDPALHEQGSRPVFGMLPAHRILAGLPMRNKPHWERDSTRKKGDRPLRRR